MNWSDERYVRLYTRDTPDWLCLSFPAQGLLCLLLRKVDRSGVLELGKTGRRAVALAIGFPGDWPRLEPALEELIADGCVQVHDDRLVIPNFIEAQEADASDAARARAYRERRRDKAKSGVTRKHEKQNRVTVESHGVTAESRSVTERHGERDARDVGDTKRDATVTPNQPTNQPPVPPNNNRLPSKADLKAQHYPETTRLLDLLNAEGYPLTYPKQLAKEVEAAIPVLGVESLAAELLPDLAEQAKVDPVTSLGWYAQRIVDAAKRPPAKANGTSTPTADWLDESWIKPGMDANRWRIVRANLALRHDQDLVAAWPDFLKAKEQFLGGTP